MGKNLPFWFGPIYATIDNCLRCSGNQNNFRQNQNVFIYIYK